MFVGREHELATLDALYGSDAFEMLVLYGRRRVGKTALVEEFCRGKNVLSFTAQMQADRDNLFDFSRAVAACFGLPESTPAFSSWTDALAFVADQAHGERLVMVIDEFPYACKSNSALPSAFQVAIDKHFKASNIFMILCGSDQGFMEDEVLSEKSPLYGRRTAQIKLRPFDYFDAARMMPDCPPEEKLSYYASLGGTPYYLEGIKADKSYVENMIDLFFSPSGRIFDEPGMFMRQELREPMVFNSVMRAISNGANKQGEIANAVGISQGSMGFYLKSLISLGLVEKVVPFGESERSRKGVYRICDPAFLFWYRFVAPYVSAVERGLGGSVGRRLLESDRTSEYEGHLFERVCTEWLVRRGRDGKLPIEMTSIGSWWGTDPAVRQTVDIDVVAADDIDKKLLVGECKWRNEINETAVLDTLRGRSRLIVGYRSCDLYLFTKNPVSSATRRRESGDARVHFVDAGEMFA